MGSPKKLGDDNERPQHRARLIDSPALESIAGEVRALLRAVIEEL